MGVSIGCHLANPEDTNGKPERREVLLRSSMCYGSGYILLRLSFEFDFFEGKEGYRQQENGPLFLHAKSKLAGKTLTIWQQAAIDFLCLCTNDGPGHPVCRM